MVEQVKESQHGVSNGEALPGKPGIVVLSPSLRILHMNRQAQYLIGDLVSTAPEVQQPSNRTGVLPQSLINLAGEILRMLRSRHEMGEKGQFETRHSAIGSRKPVFIRGLGLPNGQGVEDARIVFLLTGASADTSENHQSF